MHVEVVHERSKGQSKTKRSGMTTHLHKISVRNCFQTNQSDPLHTLASENRTKSQKSREGEPLLQRRPA